MAQGGARAEWRFSSRAHGGPCVMTSGTWPRPQSCAASCSVARPWRHPWRGGEHFGAGSGKIVLDDVQCVGGESHLGQCAHRRESGHDCGPMEDASQRRVLRGGAVTSQDVTAFMHPQALSTCVEIKSLSNVLNKLHIASIIIISHAHAFPSSGANGPPAPNPTSGSEAASSMYTLTGGSSVLAAFAFGSIYPLEDASSIYTPVEALRDGRATPTVQGL